MKDLEKTFQKAIPINIRSQQRCRTESNGLTKDGEPLGRNPNITRDIYNTKCWEDSVEFLNTLPIIQHAGLGTCSEDFDSTD